MMCLIWPCDLLWFYKCILEFHTAALSLLPPLFNTGWPSLILIHHSYILYVCVSSKFICQNPISYVIRRCTRRWAVWRWVCYKAEASWMISAHLETPESSLDSPPIWAHGEKTDVYEPGNRPSQITNLSDTWSWTSQPPEWWKISLCSL